jgi:uncharacterized protein (DUF1499 family)
MLKRLLLVLLVAGGVAAALAWPRLNDVETGHTPEYPDLKVRDYAASPDAVSRAVQGAVGHLPRWSIVGSGSGPAGSEVRAIHRTHLGFKDDVTVRIRREGGRTRVSVRSKSRIGYWDFGQNARNIRELVAELDRTLS